jgi:hypothetical protein
MFSRQARQLESGMKQPVSTVPSELRLVAHAFVLLSLVAVGCVSGAAQGRDRLAELCAMISDRNNGQLDIAERVALLLTEEAAERSSDAIPLGEAHGVDQSYHQLQMAVALLNTKDPDLGRALIDEAGEQEDRSIRVSMLSVGASLSHDDKMFNDCVAQCSSDEEGISRGARLSVLRSAVDMKSDAGLGLVPLALVDQRAVFVNRRGSYDTLSWTLARGVVGVLGGQYPNGEFGQGGSNRQDDDESFGRAPSVVQAWTERISTGPDMSLDELVVAESQCAALAIVCATWIADVVELVPEGSKHNLVPILEWYSSSASSMLAIRQGEEFAVEDIESMIAGSDRARSKWFLQFAAAHRSPGFLEFLEIVVDKDVDTRLGCHFAISDLESYRAIALLRSGSLEEGLRECAERLDVLSDVEGPLPPIPPHGEPLDGDDE